MDLREMRGAPDRRHPWETARVAAIGKVLGASLHEGLRVLDVGCGDGYVCRELFGNLGQNRVTAVDINLTREQILQLRDSAEGISYLAQLPPKGSRFDLTLLLDVVEHVEDDRLFLAEIVEHHVAEGGRVMVTVPAFQELYSSHDLFLGHYRRYRLKGVEDLARTAGLEVVSSGYLFGCLLLPKFILYKILNWRKRSEGVGSWHAGPAVTAIVDRLLRLDNSLMIMAAKTGLKVPGLTAWVLCEKPVQERHYCRNRAAAIAAGMPLLPA